MSETVNLNVMVNDERLEVLAAEIRVIDRQAQAAVLSGACEIGKRLIEAKGRLAHGMWGDWLKQNVGYSERSAQNMMRCFEEYGKNGNPQALADLGLTKAVALLSAPPEARAEMIASGEAAQLSTRELEERIRALREEDQRKQMRIEELEALAAAAPAVDEAAIEERVRAEVDKARAAADKASRDLNKRLKTAVSELTEARERIVRTDKELDEQKRRADRAERDLKDVKPVIEQVEIVPAAVQQELERLRAIAQKAPSAEVIRLRDSFERVKTEYAAMLADLGALAESSPEEAARYRAAFGTGLKRMGENIGKEAGA